VSTLSSSVTTTSNVNRGALKIANSSLRFLVTIISFLDSSSAISETAPIRSSSPAYTGRQPVTLGSNLADAMYRRKEDCDFRARQLSATTWSNGVGVGELEATRQQKVLFTKKRTRRAACIEFNQSAVVPSLKNWWFLVPQEYQEFTTTVETLKSKDGLYHYSYLSGYREDNHIFSFMGVSQDLYEKKISKKCSPVGPQSREHYEPGSKYITMNCRTEIKHSIWANYKGTLQVREFATEERKQIKDDDLTYYRSSSETFLANDPSNALLCENPLRNGVPPEGCTREILNDHERKIIDEKAAQVQ
jgi:hypothetical protein